MNRILSDRGMGKTHELLNYANFLARKYPNETILFVTNFCVTTKDFLLKRGEKIEDNVKFVSFQQFDNQVATTGYKAVIDEVDSYLRNLNVQGYSMTLSDRGDF